MDAVQSIPLPPSNIHHPPSKHDSKNIFGIFCRKIVADSKKNSKFADEIRVDTIDTTHRKV